MNALTFEETNLLCIYNPGTRQGAIEALTEMRGELSPDETELLALTDSSPPYHKMASERFQSQRSEGEVLVDVFTIFDSMESFHMPVCRCLFTNFLH